MEFPGIGVLHLCPSPAELRPFFRRKFKTQFRAYNVSGNGVITKQDMENLARQVSLNTPEEERENVYEKQWLIYKELILFFKESITEEEFVNEWITICFGNAARKREFAEKLKEVLITSFASVDINRDGIINYEEFRKFYELRSQNPNTTEVVFNSIDINSDGEISFEEWAHAFVSFVLVSGPESSFSLFYGPLVED